ncbi:tetratricopeptide repeat protein [Mucilaginibacter auburnensis]|nr:tetratricopeptide repeat protein [Mucilaginibacter auburnensis]
MFITPEAFCQSEVLKGVVNSLARYKRNKELKYLSAAKKSIDSLIAVNNDTSNFEKNVYLAVINSSVLYADSLNSLNLPADLLNKTTQLVDKLNGSRKRKVFEEDLKYVANCLANVHIRNAFNYLKKSDLLVAQQNLLSAKKYAPHFNRLDAYLAYINGRLGNLSAAASFYNNLPLTEEAWSENIEAASAVYKAVGDTTKAIKLLERVRRSSPENGFLLLDEANIYNNKRDYASLAPLLPALLESNSNNPDIVFVAANCYDRLNNFEKAEALYSQAIELNSSAYEPIFNLGLLYLRKAQLKNFTDNKDLLAATKWLEKAHEVAPLNTNNLEALRLLYTKTGNTVQLNNINNKLKQLTN